MVGSQGSLRIPEPIALLLLFLCIPALPWVLLSLPGLAVPLVYLTAALLPSAILLQKGAASAPHAVCEPEVHDPRTKQTGNVQPLNADELLERPHISTAAPEVTPPADQAAAQCPAVVRAASALLGDQLAGRLSCAGCTAGSCSWHLPPALSLDTWGAGKRRNSTSRRNSSCRSKQPSSTDDLPSPQVHEPDAAPAFSFDSSVYHSAGNALRRSLSAPAAPAGPTPAAPGLAAAGWGSFVCSPNTADGQPAGRATGAGPTAWELPGISLSMVQLGQLGCQQADPLCAASTAVLDSPGPFWSSSGAAGAAEQGIGAVPACAADMSAAPGEPLQEQWTLNPAAAGQKARSAPLHLQLQQQVSQQPCSLQASPHCGMQASPHCGMQSPQYCITLQHCSMQSPQQAAPVYQQLQVSHGDPCTPTTQLAPELLTVLNHIWQDGQHSLHQDCSQQQPAQQQPAAQQQDAVDAVPSPHSPLVQQPVFAGPATPLLFVATTTRHSGCLRQPSFRATGSPLSSSCNGAGFASGAPPLPSSAESPLARRLSARDDSGFPAASPALKQLLSSGGSRQLLRRGMSLDSRRAVSTPGSMRGSLELQEQPHEQQQLQQAVPWAGVQLRPVAHLVHEQQQLRRQQRREGVQADGSHWYQRFQLERRHTFANTMDLSVAADGAVAAANAVDGAAAAAGTLSVAAYSTSSGGSPLRRPLMGYCISHAVSSAAQDLSQWSAAMPSSALCQASPCGAAGGTGTPHRLSCSSSATGLQLESEGSGGADAAAAIVLTPMAGAAIKVL